MLGNTHREYRIHRLFLFFHTRFIALCHCRPYPELSDLDDDTLQLIHFFLRIKKGEIHINVLKFITLFIGLLIFQLEHKQYPELFPPTPKMQSLGDNQ